MPLKSDNAVLNALKSYAPVKLVAYMSDSDEDGKAIAVPNVKKRWARVTATPEKLAWCRVELLDKTGALLATVDNAEPARDVEDLPVGKGHAEHALALRICELVERSRRDAVDQANASRSVEMKELLQAQTAVMKEMTNAMRSLADVYREQVEVTAESAETRAQAEALVARAGEDGWSLEKLLEAAPVIMQVLPALKSMLGSGSPAPAPNGKRGS
jgi:DNA-directed RNA polymerase specialized sigma54-like protein